MNRIPPLSHSGSQALSLALRLCLCLALAVAGAVGVMPNHANAGLVQVVICGHDGAETLWLNAQGQAEEPRKSDCARCPDCLASGTTVALFGPVAAQAPPEEVVAMLFPAGAAQLPARPLILPVARGPPGVA